jgi:hypothetical protein
LTGESPGNIALEWCLDSLPPYPYDVRYDRTGFRNDRDLTSADIVFLGDSYIEGALVPESEIVTSVLAELTGLEVANVALAGYGPGEELAALQKIGRPLNPKFVVWAFFEGNDPENLWVYNAWVEAGRPSTSESRPSLAGTLAQRFLRKDCRPDHNRIRYHSGTFHRENGKKVPVYFLGRPSTGVSDATLSEIQAVISQAFTVTRAMDADLLVLFVPWKYRVYREAIEIPNKSRLPRWHVGDLPLRFARMLNQVSSEIRFIDLTSALAREAKAGQMVYLADDTHWSSDGHRVVAGAVAQELESHRGRRRDPLRSGVGD